MCHVLNQAVASVPKTDRRRLLSMAGLGAAGIAAAGVAGAAPAAASPGRRGRLEQGRGKVPGGAGRRTRVVMLGTAGGPALVDPDRHGVSTAIVYEDKVYVVDLGVGSFNRLEQSGLAPDTGLGSSLSWVRGIFFTHLHSDHTVDWPAVYATGSMNIVERAGDPIQVFGPGSRDTLTRVYPPTRPAPALVNPEDPTPGISSMTRHLRNAFAQDFNDRLRDSNFPDPDSLFQVHDIDHSGLWTVDPQGIPPRLDAPIRVWEDGDVKVTATLVDHRPTAPAYGFRFDTPDGSVVVSGDTCVSQNLIDLARGADVLVHEVIDPAFVDQLTASLPPGTAESVREHLLISHTTIEQVGRDVAEPAGVGTLALTHMVPGTAPTSTWRKAQRGFSGELVIGEDLLEIGVGRARWRA
ncbi:MBL fold metallo-hydrolase [Nocardioides insulae]|uniref:MBL fold metallo-hydrolase n=1 Tax=Nocardioides insulae TaxID=394734 RepID=UPI0004019EB6|nr:MBL fold metallo-hydrolase [Nocardioides insulae]